MHPDGYIEIRDRLKDVIISGGENISSVEVEGALLRHPAVPEVAVVGLPHARWGEAPHGIHRAARGRQRHRGGDASRSRAVSWLTSRPRTASTFVDELPKTATGKIQKFVLREGAPNLTPQ